MRNLLNNGSYIYIRQMGEKFYISFIGGDWAAGFTSKSYREAVSKLKNKYRLKAYRCLEVEKADFSFTRRFYFKLK